MGNKISFCGEEELNKVDISASINKDRVVNAEQEQKKKFEISFNKISTEYKRLEDKSYQKTQETEYNYKTINTQENTIDQTESNLNELSKNYEKMQSLKTEEYSLSSKFYDMTKKNGDVKVQADNVCNDYISQIISKEQKLEKSKLSYEDLQQNLKDCQTKLKIKQAQVKSEACELNNIHVNYKTQLLTTEESLREADGELHTTHKVQCEKIANLNLEKYQVEERLYQITESIERAKCDEETDMLRSQVEAKKQTIEALKDEIRKAKQQNFKKRQIVAEVEQLEKVNQKMNLEKVDLIKSYEKSMTEMSNKNNLLKKQIAQKKANIVLKKQEQKEKKELKEKREKTMSDVQFYSSATDLELDDDYIQSECPFNTAC